jgi:hypothetical protein
MKTVRELQLEVRGLREQPVGEVNARLAALSISGRPPAQRVGRERDGDVKSGFVPVRPVRANVWEERKRAQDDFMRAAAESPQAFAQVKERMAKEANERKEKMEAFKKLDELRVRRVIITGITHNLMQADGNAQDEKRVRLFIVSYGIVEESHLSEIEKTEVWKLRNNDPSDESARYMMAIQFKTVAFRNTVIQRNSGPATNPFAWYLRVRVFGDKSKAERAKEFQEKVMQGAGNGRRA